MNITKRIENKQQKINIAGRHLNSKIYINLCYDVSVRLSVCDGSALGRGACREHSGCASQRS